MRCYTLAALQKNTEAYYRLGSVFENHHGVEQDYFVAVDWYKLAG
jgi:TPR repeat protein